MWRNTQRKRKKKREEQRIKIYSKFLLCFLILAFLFNTFIIIMNYAVGQHLKNYEMVVQSFVRMNDITTNVDQIVSSLNQYLDRGYEDQKTELLHQLEELERNRRLMDTDFNVSIGSHYRLDNLNNLLSEFMLQVNQTIHFYSQQKIKEYTDHYNESIKVSHFIVEYTQNLTSFELTSYRDQIAKVTKSRELIETMGKTTFLVSILLSIFFSLIVYGGISIPINQLVARSRRISSGDFDVSDIRPVRKDEIGVLMQAYKVMGENIEKLLREAKSQEEYKRLLQEMELKSLQSQINPHFLFNTLNIISRIAYHEKASKTEELMHSLAKLLRYNLRRIERHVTLQEEVNMLYQYLHIQKTRFQEWVDIHMDIDEQCLNIKLPSLTLQPFVENIFVHGIRSQESLAQISIRIRDSMEYVTVEIQDNGVGMSQETIDQIMGNTYRETKQTDTTGLGIGNVIRRLQIYYGMDRVVSIESEPLKGTSVQLYLPKQDKVA
jgi:two-component system, sensor histidine kinase YesM